MKKSNFVLGVIVGVLIMAILGCGFYLGTKFVAKGDDKKDEETKEETKSSEFKDISLTDSLVVEASKFNVYYMCHGPVYSFPKESVKVEDISDEVKTEMAFGRYASEMYEKIAEAYDTENIEAVKIKEEDLKRYFKDISFLDKYKNGKDITPNSVAAVGKYKDGVYSFTAYPTGCEGYSNDYTTTLVSAKKNDKQLILRYAYYFLKYDINKDESNSYKAKGDKEIVEKALVYDEEIKGYKIDPSKYDNFEFVFDISEGNLQLEAINYVK